MDRFQWKHRERSNSKRCYNNNNNNNNKAKEMSEQSKSKAKEMSEQGNENEQKRITALPFLYQALLVKIIFSNTFDDGLGVFRRPDGWRTRFSCAWYQLGWNGDFLVFVVGPEGI